MILTFWFFSLFFSCSYYILIKKSQVNNYHKSFKRSPIQNAIPTLNPGIPLRENGNPPSLSISSNDHQYTNNQLPPSYSPCIRCRAAIRLSHRPESRGTFQIPQTDCTPAHSSYLR